MRLNRLLRDVLDQLAQTHGQTLLLLLGRHKIGVQHRHIARHERDLQAMLTMEVLEKVAQWHILNIKARPQCPFPVIVLVHRCGNGVTECDEGQRQVHERIGVRLNVALVVHQLVHLQIHQTRNERRCRGNRRNNLASDALGRVTVDRLDLVVGGTQIRGRRNKINVVVRVVVFFKLGRRQTIACHGSRGRQTRNDLLQARLVFRRVCALARRRITVVDLYLGLFRHKLGHLDLRRHLGNVSHIRRAIQAIVEGM